MRIISVGHAFFAVIMIALGILGLIKGDFTSVWAPVPEAVPEHEILIYLCAFVSLASGVGLLWRPTAAVAARVLLVFFLLWFLLLRVPYIFFTPGVGAFWSCSKTAVMMVAALVLYNWFAGDWEREHLGFATGNTGLRIARTLYGLALIPFGAAHFIYLNETIVLIPGWLPSPVAWAYFTGGAFIAAGIAVITGVYSRLAATLSTLEMGLFGLVVWIPIVATGSISEFQWGEFVVTFVLTAGAWVVTDSYRGTPWLGWPTFFSQRQQREKPTLPS